MYACSSIIQFSWIIKLYVSIKSDWVSCCSWDFLASHQTCRQNCSNSLFLSEMLSCHLSVTVFLLYWAFSFWPSQLFGPECNKKNGQDGLCPHHVHNPSREMKIDFCSFERPGKSKAVLLLTHFCVFPRKKRQKSGTGLQLLDPGASDRMQGLPDAMGRWSAKSFCRDSLKCEGKGQWHLHISEPSADIFQGSKNEGLMELLQKQSLFYLFIYLFVYACMYLNPDFPEWHTLEVTQFRVTSSVGNWGMWNVGCWSAAPKCSSSAENTDKVQSQTGALCWRSRRMYRLNWIFLVFGVA